MPQPQQPPHARPPPGPHSAPPPSLSIPPNEPPAAGPAGAVFAPSSAEAPQRRRRIPNPSAVPPPPPPAPPTPPTPAAAAPDHRQPAPPPPPGPPLATTPRPSTPTSVPLADTREAAGLTYTPASSSSQLREYKYYCPICMLYFQQMMATRCCSQYTCWFCLKDQVRHRLTQAGFTATLLEACKQIQPAPGDSCSPDQLFGVDWCKLPPPCCPFCSVSPYGVTAVGLGDTVRRYADSPAAARRLQMQTPGGPSPLRCGAEWEELTRKMRPLPAIADPRADSERWRRDDARSKHRRRPLEQLNGTSQRPRGAGPQAPPLSPVSPPGSSVPSPPALPVAPPQDAAVDCGCGAFGGGARRTARRNSARPQPPGRPAAVPAGHMRDQPTPPPAPSGACVIC
eukprot:TRINITY_DN17588_c0_g1_i1.p1 TRINITY_DN17588_c0_g1~~TRINITY_DN17588_c0_g1_i1.p1  ORF type:complete len:425 (+),score=73.25 TRINITY_DN17588_c0_g1_i1:87-1277(+)